MYKFVAIDLDGTMLNSYGMLSQNNKKSMIEASNKGAQIVIASGRPITSSKVIAKETEVVRYIISGNGALIYDLQEDKVIYEKYLSKEKVLEIIDICEQNSIWYNVYTDKTILAQGFKYNVLYYHKENIKKEENQRTSITIVENMRQYIENLENENFLKITVCDEIKTVFDSIIKKLRGVKNIKVLDVAHMSRKTITQGTEEIQIEYYYSEISSKDVDKWNAIKYLIDYLGIPKEETIAIGDNINDKTMIENSGLGIAMKGSTPQIAENADFITDGNNEDGVAKALNKYV